MVGNPYHGKDGKFTSGKYGAGGTRGPGGGGSNKASGHNAGEGNRAVASHIQAIHNSADRFFNSGTKVSSHKRMISGASIQTTSKVGTNVPKAAFKKYISRGAVAEARDNYRPKKR